MAQKSHLFHVGTIQIPVPENGRPEGCPLFIDVDLGDRIANWEIPDPDPETQPDWPTFRLAIYSCSEFFRIANTDLARFAVLNTVLWQVATDPGKFHEVAILWNAIAQQANPTTPEIEAINAIAAASNIPLHLNSAGLIALE
jgi:hypothetical protein